MLEDVKRILDATVGALTPARARELARSMAGEASPEKVSARAQEILAWSRQNTERLRGIVDKEVSRQLHARGIATREEVSALRERLAKLEGTSRGAPARSGRKPTAARKPNAKRKPTAARKPASSAKD
jgi:polyhydroxyalkanoate synthesis regulator phasin